MPKNLLGLILLLLIANTTPPGAVAQVNNLALSPGDGLEDVGQKIAVMQKIQPAGGLLPLTLQTRFLDRPVRCTVRYLQDKLYNVLIEFSGVEDASYNTELKQLVMKTINPALVKANGAPSTVNDYPEAEEVGDILAPVAEWDLDGKTILSGVMKDESGYHAKVEIYDDRLVKARE